MLQVKAIHAFSDNYIWCIYDSQQKQAVVVDPGCSEAVLNFIAKEKLTLTGILITHHHPDHIGGVAALLESTNAEVYGFSQAGPKNAPLTFIDNTFNEGDCFSLLGASFKVLEVPGHTLDHIAFYSEPSASHHSPWLFCGDTLFSGGCGRLFEGTAVQMFNSLNKFCNLPKNCEIYCAHEYTLSNLDFAVSLMPDNQALQSYQSECEAKRKNKQITLPSTIELELLVNPFLRSDDSELKASLTRTNPKLRQEPEYIFEATRKAKDIF